jgi:hypothetical protein
MVLLVRRRIIFRPAEFRGQFAHHLSDADRWAAEHWPRSKQPDPSCVPPAPQLKREWSSWPKFGWIPQIYAKGIICDDISEFESHMPSHTAVRNCLKVDRPRAVQYLLEAE